MGIKLSLILKINIVIFTVVTQKASATLIRTVVKKLNLQSSQSICRIPTEFIQKESTVNTLRTGSFKLFKQFKLFKLHSRGF